MISGDFTIEELQHVLKKLRKKRCPGPDKIPAEFWIAFSSIPEGLQVLLDLCNRCWNTRSIPKEWKHSCVASIFKKGDDSMPSNYRPIFITCGGIQSARKSNLTQAEIIRMWGQIAEDTVWFSKRALGNWRYLYCPAPYRCSICLQERPSVNVVLGLGQGIW